MTDDPNDELEALIDQRAQIDRQLLEKHSREMAILFSDIVGSTGIYEKQGDVAGLAMVRRHNAILFPVIERHGGRVVKTIGDAILAVFEDLAQGVRCAAAMQASLAAARVPGEGTPIHIRVGVHAGRVMLDRGDVFGDAVNTAARIVGQAKADEVLLSAELVERVADEVGLSAEQRAPVALKGKAQPMPLRALRWREEPAPLAAPPELVVLELARGPDGLKVAIVDGPADEGPLRSYAELPIRAEALDALAGRFAAFLGGESPAYVEGLGQLGRELFDAALSERARTALRATPRRYLRLQLDDGLAHLPWELLHDGSDFLSLHLSVGRVVSARGDAPVRSERAGGGHALVVSDPLGDLPAAREEGATIERLLRDGWRGEVRHLRGPVDRKTLLAGLAGCGLLHFAGHVIRASPQGAGGLELADGPLSAEEMRRAIGAAAPELVFANGCHAGGVRGFTDLARRTSDLAAGLLLQGVRHFVGPMGEIPDADALAFALRFYEGALSGRPLGDAVRGARRALIDAGGKRLSFGRYLFYGDPRDRLETVRSTRAAAVTRSSAPKPGERDSGKATPAQTDHAPPHEAAAPAPRRDEPHSGSTSADGRSDSRHGSTSSSAQARPDEGIRSAGSDVPHAPGADMPRAAASAPQPNAPRSEDATPPAPRSGPTLRAIGIAVAALAILGVIGVLVLHPRAPVAPPQPVTPKPVVAHAEKPAAPVVHTGPICVAMLPFKNLTGDPKLDFLGGGMMEAVLTDLGGQHGLHVVEHDQIQADIDYMKFTNDARVSDPKTRAELGKIQGCETVLLGGYQKWNGQIRATARIIQVETGAVLVAAKVDRPQGRVFELQDAVASALHGELPALQKALRP